MLTIYLDNQSKEPFYQQIYEALKKLICEGKLNAKEKLPSCRKLAEHLGVSRATVDLAYAQLVSEGYVESVVKSGYYVCELDQMILLPPTAMPGASPGYKKEIPKYQYDFSPDGIDSQGFPYAIWRRLMRETMSHESGDLFEMSEPHGNGELRYEIAKYLYQSRNVACQASDIIIGAGTQYLLMVLSRLLGTDTIIAMENPTYLQVYQTFHTLNHQVIPIPVNEEGIKIEELIKSEARVAYVTPSHQYPLGVVMPVNHRMKLLNWARKEEDRYIIEDDYDSEFRYQGKPIPSLQGLGQGKKVIYMGTFSKVISPAIRMSYMVLPKRLMKKYDEMFQGFPSTVSKLDQVVVGRFMKEGYFERHLNRMRNLYKQKHDLMIRELKSFGDLCKVTGTNAGSYVIVEWRGSMSERQLQEEAKKVGIHIYSLKEYCIEPLLFMNPTFLVGFSKTDLATISAGIQILKRIWK